MLLFQKWTTKRPEKQRESRGGRGERETQRQRDRGKLLFQGRTGQLPDVLSAAG